jgi:DNA polymerase-3 subunit alpha
MADFVHLRVKTAYSLAEGAIKLPDLAKVCANHQVPAIAMTDTSNLLGAYQFSDKISGKGVQPIVGCEIRLAMEDEFGPSVALGAGPQGQPFVLLATSREGFLNLSYLVSRAHLDRKGDDPVIPFSWFSEKLEGRPLSSDLIALTGGPRGPIDTLLLRGANGDAAAAKGAETRLLRLREMFGDRLYVEVQRHFTPAERAVEGLGQFRRQIAVTAF